MKNGEVLDIENGINFNEVVQQLLNLKYIRITRIVNFLNNYKYEFITEIDIYNQGDKTCHYIPSEIYNKAILVDFKVINPSNSVQISSDTGDRLNIKFNLFCLKGYLSEYINNLERLSKPKNLIREFNQILNFFDENRNECKDFIQKLFPSFWSAETSIKSLIDEVFKNSLEEILNDKKIKRFYDFLVRMDNNFVQFIYLREGIKSKGYINLRIKTIKEIDVKKIKKKFNRCLEKILQYEIPFNIGKPFPLKGENTLFIKINIPSQERFYYLKNKYLKKSSEHIQIFDKKDKKVLEDINLIFDKNYFNISHDNEQLFCKNLKEKGDIIDVYEDFKEKHQIVENIEFRKFKPDVDKFETFNELKEFARYYGVKRSDTRLNFGDNNISLYFRQKRKKNEKDIESSKIKEIISRKGENEDNINGNKSDEHDVYCEERLVHIIRFHRTLRNNLIPFYFLFIVACLILYPIFFFNDFNEYIQIFIGIIIVAIFHYINTSKIERFYLGKPFRYFIVLSIVLYIVFQILHFIL